jgi:hypothetical protein
LVNSFFNADLHKLRSKTSLVGYTKLTLGSLAKISQMAKNFKKNDLRGCLEANDLTMFQSFLVLKEINKI